jgi:hypothetical protein
MYEVSSGVNRRGSPLKYTSRATYDKNAIAINRLSDSLNLNLTFLIGAITEKDSTRINTMREYVNGIIGRPSISMIDVNITDIVVEVKKPSTVNFTMLLMSRRRAVRRITPGMI